MRAFRVVALFSLIGIVGMVAIVWKLASSRHASTLSTQVQPEETPTYSRPPRFFPNNPSVERADPTPVREQRTVQGTPPSPSLMSGKEQFAIVRKALERSGASSTDRTTKVLGIIDTWKSKATAELRGAVYFSSPQCFAQGCFFTADIEASAPLNAVRDGFIYESGFLEWQGGKTAFAPTNDESGNRVQLAFALYDPDFSPNTIEAETRNQGEIR